MQCSLRVFAPAVFCFILILCASPSLFSQSTSGSSSAPSVSLPGSPQNPFLGSAAEGQATQEVLKIDFKEAIERGLRNNLGLLLAGDQTESARGERWKQLAELLPNVSGKVQEDVQTTALAALGFNKLFPLFVAPGTNTSRIPRVV